MPVKMEKRFTPQWIHRLYIYLIGYFGDDFQTSLYGVLQCIFLTLAQPSYEADIEVERILYLWRRFENSCEIDDCCVRRFLIVIPRIQSSKNINECFVVRYRTQVMRESFIGGKNIFQTIVCRYSVPLSQAKFDTRSIFKWSKVLIQAVLIQAIQFKCLKVQFKCRKTVLFQAIEFSISTQLISIQPIDRDLSGNTTPGQSGSRRDGNEEVLRIPQSPSITGTSPSDCLVHTQDTRCGGGAYPSAEKQSVYCTSPADRATECFSMCKCAYLVFRLFIVITNIQMLIIGLW